MPNTPKFSASQLKHGDVLLYVHKKHISFFVFGIRLITGSKFVHSSVVQKDAYITSNNAFVLEQLADRTHSWLPFYYADEGEEIHIVRPKFKVPGVIPSNFEHRPYGYLSIIDCLINHTMNIITLKHWKFRSILGRNSNNRICSALVAMALNLSKNTTWCTDIKIIEPDDYYNHSETFKYLGIVDWTK